MLAFFLIRSAEGDPAEYGVRVDMDGKPFREYPRLSRDKKEVERLIRRMERGSLSPVHIDDVVRDYILALAYDRIERNRL